MKAAQKLKWIKVFINMTTMLTDQLYKVPSKETDNQMSILWYYSKNSLVLLMSMKLVTSL